MATQDGFVQKMTWFGDSGLVFVYVGPAPDETTLFLVRILDVDSPARTAVKRQTMRLLVEAQTRGYPVTVTSPASSSEIESVVTQPLPFSPAGQPVHDDSYFVAGSGFPAGVQLVFHAGATSVTVVPDFVRPHLVGVTALPSTIPPGRSTLVLQAGAWATAPLPVDVSSGPAYTIRTIYSGDPRRPAYAIAFIGNPAIERPAAGTFDVDPVMTNRPAYNGVVTTGLNQLFNVTETVFADVEQNIRLFSIFDPTRGVADAVSLVHELDGSTTIVARRARYAAFMATYARRADVAFGVSGSTTHTRASAWYTTDDLATSTPFVYDGAQRFNGHFADTPGTSAISLALDPAGLTVIHELGHAASEWTQGRITDLYVDGMVGGFNVNKKHREAATDPVPSIFAVVDVVLHTSDQTRDGLGYPTDWSSYHPTLLDPNNPNLMDNYWMAPIDPQDCRLDRLTRAWLAGRLQAKMSRSG